MENREKESTEALKKKSSTVGKQKDKDKPAKSNPQKLGDSEPQITDESTI